jgi:hypothetical protein
MPDENANHYKKHPNPCCIWANSYFINSNSSTRSALMSFRQRVCPSGHSRAKQGAQSSGGW